MTDNANLKKLLRAELDKALDKEKGVKITEKREEERDSKTEKKADTSRR